MWSLEDFVGFVGVRWLSLVFVGFRWASLVFVGVRWFSLVLVGFRWRVGEIRLLLYSGDIDFSDCIVVRTIRRMWGFCGISLVSLVFVGARWFSLVFVGVSTIFASCSLRRY